MAHKGKTVEAEAPVLEEVCEVPEGTNQNCVIGDHFGKDNELGEIHEQLSSYVRIHEEMTQSFNQQVHRVDALEKQYEKPRSHSPSYQQNAPIGNVNEASLMMLSVLRAKLEVRQLTSPSEPMCQGIHENHKIMLAVMYFEGEAMQWYHWWIDLNSQANRDQFKAELLLRFGNTSFVNYEVELRNLKQVSSVQEYQSHFERLSCMVRNRPEEALIGHFVGGLVEDIQIEMLAQPPVELRDCFVMA
ncbi:hypothetical protein EJ110_NYTH55985 [Nymphaea thermarum]|nr:hypothetical protein EJ110_NYTH55985 [Nymphaea thermarum]